MAQTKNDSFLWNTFYILKAFHYEPLTENESATLSDQFIHIPKARWLRWERGEGGREQAGWGGGDESTLVEVGGNESTLLRVGGGVVGESTLVEVREGEESTLVEVGQERTLAGEGP